MNVGNIQSWSIVRQYGAILMDPAWPFDTYSRKGVVPARGAQPYKPMPLYQIAGLPVPDLLAKDGAVFMWQSDSLPHATNLLAGVWGLRIVTNPVFIWKKPSIGMGYWGRKRAETVVMMVKGRPRRLSGGVDQVIEAPRREHSRKPDDIYARVEALVAGPYLELFARQQWPGWDAWGNEVSKFNHVPTMPNQSSPVTGDVKGASHHA